LLTAGPEPLGPAVPCITGILHGLAAPLTGCIGADMGGR